MAKLVRGTEAAFQNKRPKPEPARRRLVRDGTRGRETAIWRVKVKQLIQVTRIPRGGPLIRSRIASMSATTNCQLRDRKLGAAGGGKRHKPRRGVSVASFLRHRNPPKMTVPYQVANHVSSNCWCRSGASMPLVNRGWRSRSAGRTFVLMPAPTAAGRMVDRGNAGRIHGIHRAALPVAVRADCSCFPWLKRRNTALFLGRRSDVAAAVIAAWFCASLQPALPDHCAGGDLGAGGRGLGL